MANPRDGRPTEVAGQGHDEPHRARGLTEGLQRLAAQRLRSGAVPPRCYFWWEPVVPPQQRAYPSP